MVTIREKSVVLPAAGAARQGPRNEVPAQKVLTAGNVTQQESPERWTGHLTPQGDHVR